MKWLWNWLFGNKLQSNKEIVEAGKEDYLIDGLTYKRQRTNVSFCGHDRLFAYRYWCPKCGTELSEGPGGGMSVSAVCHICKVNHGCLPNYFGRV